MKRKSFSEIKSPSKVSKGEAKPNGASIEAQATPKKNRKSLSEVQSPTKVSKNEIETNEVSFKGKATPKKNRKSVSNSEPPAKISKKEKETNGVSVRDERTPKKSKKHLMVEKKSDKDLFSLNAVPEDVDVVENLNEDEFLDSSSEEEASDTKSKKKTKGSKDKAKTEDSDEEDEDEDDDDDDDDENDDDDSDQVDEKLIADDDSDEEAEVQDEDPSEKKKDFGQTSVLIAAPSYIKKKKLEKGISKLNTVVTRCLHIYGNTFLVSCETRDQAQALLEQKDVQVSGQPLRISKLPFFVILENLPNFIKVEDVKKAVSSCIEKSTIKNVVALHINKCFVEFTTEQAFERFTKKVSKLNISGKTVKVVSWLKKIIDEYSARSYKLTHLPLSANVENLTRKLLENDIKSKEIYQIKFFARNVCSLYSLNAESEEKFLALDSKLKFDKGTVFISLSTLKVVLNNLPELISEKKVAKALKNNGIIENNIHSVKVLNGKAVVELKTKEEEQKVLELDSVLELEGSKIEIVPLSVARQNSISLGLLKLPPSTTKTEVLEAFAKEGHDFDEKDVEFEYGEKNSVVFLLNGSESLQQKLSSLHKLSIGDGPPAKISFCKFGSQKVPANSSRKQDRKRVQSKQKKHKQKMNKKKKKKEAESD